MATNYIQKGDTITVVAPATVKSGDIVEVGKLAGIAVTDAASGSPVEIMTRGVFEVAKVSAQAWTVGAPVYVDTGEATTTASTNTPIGHAIAPASNPSATGLVRLSI